MKFSHLGLLFLLPIALMGCGASPDTASTDTGVRTDASTPGASRGATKVIEVGDSGVQFSLPSSWTAKQTAVGTTYISPNQNVSVSVSSTPDADATIENWKTNVKGFQFKNYKENGPPAPAQVGALASSEQTGTVEMGNSSLSWILETVKNKTPVVFRSFIDDARTDQDMAEYKAIMASVKTTG